VRNKNSGILAITQNREDKSKRKINHEKELRASVEFFSKQKRAKKLNEWYERKTIH